MGKISLFIILVLAGLIILNKEKVSDYKKKIIEAVNPAVKEKRLLGELGSSLDQLENLLSGKENLPSQGEVNKKAKTALNSFKKTLEELRETNEKTDLGASLSNLIQKFIPLVSEPSPTWLPPGQECK